MQEYIYDGSFEGLLTAIFYAYPQKEKVLLTRACDYTLHLLNQPLEIPSEEDKFERVYNSIKNKLSSSILKTIYYIYLSEISGCENLILDYLKLCYTHGIQINLAKNHDTIINVDMLSKKVSHEVHRFIGFVRFIEIAPLYFYSKIEPDHNILPLLIEHFTTRFSDQNFIIHDVKRKVALVYNQEDAYLRELSENEDILFSQYESKDAFEDLFRSFYTSVTITERTNPRLHRRLMPLRYRKYLVELTP